MEKVVTVKFQHTALSMTWISHELSMGLYKRKLANFPLPLKLLFGMVAGLFLLAVINALLNHRFIVLLRIIQLAIIISSFYLLAIIAVYFQSIKSGGKWLEHQTVIIDSECISVSYDGGIKEYLNWRAIESIYISQKTVYLMTGEMSGIFIPLEVFTHPQLTTFNELIETVERAIKE